MQHIQGILASTPLLCAAATLPPVSINLRSRYVILRRHSGAFAFELRAHNGSCLLSSDDDAPTLAATHVAVEKLRQLVTQCNQRTQSPMADQDAAPHIECRQSLTGKWYFVVQEGPVTVASSRPFDYRSRMDKALYAVRACAPSSRVVVDE